MRHLHFGLLGLFAVCAHGATYQLDDGTSESSSGFDVDGNVAWMQTYRVANGMNEITSISLAFGSPNRFDDGNPENPFDHTPLTGGETFKVYVWSGQPYSASHPLGPSASYTLLAQAEATVDAASVDTDVLQTVPISAIIPGGDGAEFFIGASINIPGFGWPAAFDRAPVQGGGNILGPAFLAGAFEYDGFNPNDIRGGTAFFPLQISNFIADGQWLLRANAIPEPATGLTLLGGVLLLLRRR